MAPLSVEGPCGAGRGTLSRKIVKKYTNSAKLSVDNGAYCGIF